MFVFGIVSALATAASDGWSRGVDGKLSVLADGTSYTFAYGSHTFTSEWRRNRFPLALLARVFIY